MRCLKSANLFETAWVTYLCFSQANYSCKFNSTFRYPKSFEFETLVKEYHLVCERYFSRIYFIMANASGSFVGSLVIAVLADRKGRRPAMLLSMLTMGSGAVLETLMPNLPTIFIMSFLKGFGKWALFQVCLLYIVEIMGYQKRFKKLYWISYNSVAGITFLIPYCLGKIFATFFISYVK